MNVGPLYLMVKGFVAAMKSIFWASILLGAALSLWSVVSVILLHPIVLRVQRDTYLYSSCDRCGYAFSSVWGAFVTLVQTVLFLDDWGTLALPLIEDTPWVLGLFGSIYLTVGV